MRHVNNHTSASTLFGNGSLGSLGVITPKLVEEEARVAYGRSGSSKMASRRDELVDCLALELVDERLLYQPSSWVVKSAGRFPERAARAGALGLVW